MSKKNLVIVTSKENFVWTSMTEIIPWIENIWGQWATIRQVPVQVINVDELSLGQALKILMNAELMVVTCFNLRIARFLTKLRSEFSIDVKMAFYLHNQATIACWPLLNWKLLSVMNENDTFIGTCARDAEAMKLNFHNAQTEIIPFSIAALQAGRKAKTFNGTKRKFTYIGRISAQKNLHTLIWAMGLLKERGIGSNWELHVFGQDDEMGSPLMGIPQIHYKEYLEKLISDAGLSGNIFFRGFIPRELIEKEMDDDKWIFVSPSLHGDENFGMAAFRCLVHGHNVVLSDWGGHSDFLKKFKTQSHGVRVYQGEYGPWIDAAELAVSLEQAAKNDQSFDPSLEYYENESLFLKMDKIWQTTREPKEIFPTPLATDILKRRIHFVEIHEKLILQNRMKLKESQRFSQIFENYADKVAHSFHRAYGMENLKLIAKGGEVLPAPWVNKSHSIEIQDPHRGEWKFDGKDDIFLAENGWATVFRRF